MFLIFAGGFGAFTVILTFILALLGLATAAGTGFLFGTLIVLFHSFGAAYQAIRWAFESRKNGKVARDVA